MGAQELGPTRRDWGIDNPKLVALLDLMHEQLWANVHPFLGAERALLGVAESASKREVKNAYRRQARKLHPDRGGDEAAMKALNAAYKQVLAAAKA